MNAKVEYHERGSRKIASQIQLLIRKLFADALNFSSCASSLSQPGSILSVLL